jgi:hypothetical protein
MKGQRKGPGRKAPSKRNSPENTEGKRPDERQPPAAPERTEQEESGSEQPLSESPETSRRQPVTNQDEQEKITNAGAGETPLVEE